MSDNRKSNRDLSPVHGTTETSISKPFKFGVPHHDREGRYTSRSADDRDHDKQVVHDGHASSRYIDDRADRTDRADRFDDDRGDRGPPTSQRYRNDDRGDRRQQYDHDGQNADDRVDCADRGRDSSRDRDRDRDRSRSTSSAARFLDDRADRHKDDPGDRREHRPPFSGSWEILDHRPSSSQKHHSDDRDRDRGDRDDRHPPIAPRSDRDDRRHRDVNYNSQCDRASERDRGDDDRGRDDHQPLFAPILDQSSSKRDPDHSDERDRGRDRDSSTEHHDMASRTDRDDCDDRRTPNRSDDEYDLYTEAEEEVVEGAADIEYVSFRTLATCWEFMGDDLPTVQPKTEQTKVVSSFRNEPVKEKPADYIPGRPL
jgi:hypothetical protein